MQGSPRATLCAVCGGGAEYGAQTRTHFGGGKKNITPDGTVKSWIIMSRHYNWTSRIPYLSLSLPPPLPPPPLPAPHLACVPPPTRKLSVLLRIKISSKSYGRLQTNRAVSFPTGCRNFRRLSTFPTAPATSPILPPPAPTLLFTLTFDRRRRSAK